MVSEDVEYALLLPFVVVASKDGPYDDDAYTVGWEAATVRTQLAGLPPGALMAAATRRDNRPQIDLIAMEAGFTADFAAHDDEWDNVTFHPAEGS